MTTPMRWAVCLPLLFAAGCAKHYPMEGVVLQVDSPHRTILVSHRPIDGYMPAMAMPFHVAPNEDLAKLSPGTRLNFELSVGKHESVARKLRPRVARLEGPGGQEIRVPPPTNKVAIGAELPDFSLTDQAGRTVKLSDFRGRVVGIDFIYTRCPMADVCPRLSANFGYVAKRMRGRDLTLLSITLDPSYDRPEVLAEYGHRYSADGETWRFLTGTDEEVRKAAGLFGLIYWIDDGAITHTAATAVVGRDGKLGALIEGSSYRPEQLRDLIGHALDAPTDVAK